MDKHFSLNVEKETKVQEWILDRILWFSQNNKMFQRHWSNTRGLEKTLRNFEGMPQYLF